MGRPKAEKIRNQISMRLDDDEKEAFERRARSKGLPMTTWLRTLGREDAGLNPKADIAWRAPNCQRGSL